MAHKKPYFLGKKIKRRFEEEKNVFLLPYRGPDGGVSGWVAKNLRNILKEEEEEEKQQGR